MQLSYGLTIVRPEMSCRIREPSDAELKAIKWHRFKSNTIFYLQQAALITAMCMCFAFSFVTMMRLMNA